MKGLKSIVFVTAIVLLLFAVGCSNAAPPTASPPTTTPTQPATPAPAAAPSPPAPQLPLALGTYTNEKTFHGSETLTLLDGSRYTELVPEAGRLIKGNLTLTSDQVTFTETEGGVCTGTPGTYTWAFDGKTLTFTNIQDDCLPRSGDHPSGPWIKQP